MGPPDPLPRLPRDPDDDYSAEAVEARRSLLQRATGLKMEHLCGKPVELVSARGNVEGLVGFASIPIGVAGPLRVDTSDGLAEVYVPFATNEGAMVASYGRGMALLRGAGGARARVLRDSLSQHPMLVYADAAGAAAGAARARLDMAAYQKRVAQASSYGRLVEVTPRPIGRRLILRLVFTTGDALGINMAARASAEIARDLALATGAAECYVHGQDVEKRANAAALVEPRGKSVVCDVVLPRALVEQHLHVEPEALAAIARSYAVGFAGLGTQNWAIQSANGLAAIYLACGQDVAYVVESASGYLELEVTQSGDLYAGLQLPNLLVGSVGGGSSKGTAAECLELMGCLGAGKARRLAELIGAAILAGDLSLMGAFCAGDFVSAHERLGRNRPPQGAR